MAIANNWYIFYLISVVYIKEELEDAAFEVKIEPAVNSSLVKEELDGAAFDEENTPAMNLLLNKEDDSAKDLIVEKQNQINEFVMKEQSTQDELVSIWKVWYLSLIDKYWVLFWPQSNRIRWQLVLSFQVFKLSKFIICHLFYNWLI